MNGNCYSFIWGKEHKKIWMSGVRSEVNIEKLMAAVTFRQRKNITIVDADESEEAYRSGRQATITVQPEMKTLKAIPETVKVGDIRLVMFVEGHKPRCFCYRQKGHIKA